jgi:hypothetical protein
MSKRLEKTCEHCRQPFMARVLPSYEGPSRFAKRRFCGTASAYQAKIRSEVKERRCIRCDEIIIRRVFARGPECPSKFNRRKFCSWSCAAIHHGTIRRIGMAQHGAAS